MLKPISARYFVRENRKRCAVLIFMFMLTYITYLGGLYITNVGAMFECTMERWDKLAEICPYVNMEGSQEEYEAAKEEIEDNEKIIQIQAGVISNILVKNIMNFDCGFSGFSFVSVEDFKIFCEYMDIDCDFDNLKAGSLITSKLSANSRGMKLGDILTEGENEFIYGSYTLDAITNEDGYAYYYIYNGSGINYVTYLLPVAMTDNEFAEYQTYLSEKYNIEIYNGENFREEINRDLNTLNVLYIFICLVLAVIMGVTIHAIFVGVYQQRNYEFAVYRAIGIQKKQIIIKVIKELLLIDLIGIIIGGIVSFTGIFLINHLYLIPHGLRLCYYHPIALFGIVLCNFVAMVPLIFTRCRQLLKADICEY